MKKLFRPHLTFILMGALMAFSACDDHGHEPHDHEGELITTMTLTMTPQNGGTPITTTFRDVDGDGGQAPVMTPSQVVLSANTLYNTNITVLDESHDSKDLTNEIREEGHEHELFFLPSPADLLTVTKTDLDKNNRPIGLQSTIQTGAAKTGTLRVVLKHQPGLKTATSNVNTGETDADVTYNIQVK
ncbi:hypothetical protein ABID22_001102 [Pontibacter aydingkolensis]|uniref:Type 1 periplasmic binding fold superfamily protein n=1 Tax=Pontibacter aydingkolensis TaxID=1911536 RepID=A0ABS7CT48_9BACT|nr:hypothetical protein [Pontibacter aydingkolensis]MBW7467012.1 hypothetical protein [Pontibacter aydingkolensis]